MSDVIPFIIAGLVTGGMYALIALGLSLVFGVMRFINVAHGDFVTLGAYGGVIYASWEFGPAIAAVLLGIVLAATVGIIIERGAIAKLVSREGHINEQRALVFTLGLSLVMGNGILAIFGSTFQSGQSISTTTVKALGMTIQGQRLVVFAGSLAITALLFAFLYLTRIGLAIRAASENPDATLASGVDLRRIRTVTFAIGAGLAGIAGVLIAPLTYAYPAMGLPLTMKAFIVVVLGGLGSLRGALIAGYTLGIVESIGVLWLPTGYNAALGPIIMLILLAIRPQGLFGRKVRIA